jgi:transposase
MRTPIFVRPVTDAERRTLEAGLCSAGAFTLRRRRIILASSRGERAPRIAEAVGCDDRTVRIAIRAFGERGIEALTPGSSRPRTIRRAYDGERAEGLRELLHRSPRDFGRPTGVRTLGLAAEVSAEQGIVAGPVSDETVRRALSRLGVGRERAKRWIASPDPGYAREKAPATG